jgi:hypothetical protein
MAKTAEFGVPCAAVPQHGACRICGCTEISACTIGRVAVGHGVGFRACGWADGSQTLCDSPNCIAAARREINR